MTLATQDFFLQQIADAPFKDDRSLMEFPFFSLQKRPRHEPIEYSDGDIQISVHPGPKGIATIYDKDLLIYIASIITAQLNRGEQPDRTIRFPAYDFLKTTGRGSGKRAYDLFLDAIFRLRSTTISTSIASAGKREQRGFGWIEGWRIIEKKTKNGRSIMAAVEITINRWMHAAIVKDRRILTINPAYFQLTKGLERRLYEIARKHVGYQPGWYIGLSRLALKCGSDDTLRKFRFRIKQIAEDNNLPDYGLTLRAAKDIPPLLPFKITEPAVHFWRKEKKQETTIESPSTKPLGERSLTVSYEAFQRVQDAFPGYDMNYLESRWQEWSRSQGEAPKSPDRAFHAWCKRYTESNPL